VSRKSFPKRPDLTLDGLVLSALRIVFIIDQVVFEIGKTSGSYSDK
jgi:hypothetical protein